MTKIKYVKYIVTRSIVAVILIVALLYISAIFNEFEDIGSVFNDIISEPAVIAGISASALFLTAFISFVNGPKTDSIVKGPTAATRVSVEEIAQIRGELGDIESSSSQAVVIHQLSGRATKLQARATVILALIVVSLSAGLLGVVFAGRLTSLDVTATSIVDRAQVHAERARGQLDEIDSNIRQVQSGEALQKFSARPFSIRGSSELEPATSEELDSEEITAITKTLIVSREDASKLNASAVTILEQAWAAEIERAQSDRFNNQNFVLATSVTRIGILVVVIFLVQILINLYRYNIRLATFYNSRVDALYYANSQAAAFESTIGYFTPDNVDFGSTPKPMLNEVTDVVLRKRRTDDSENTTGKKEPPVS